LELGVEEYGAIFKLQEQLNEARRNKIIQDIVIFLEHHPCFTIGRKGTTDHILVSEDRLKLEGIKVYETDRGGDVTYHGPGQLVCYPIIDLNNYGRDVHSYARNMEEILIRTLDRFGIKASRKLEYPGVWVGPAKIAAEGIAMRNWVTQHGVALNICPNMYHFSLIVPCGITSFGVTSMEALLGNRVELTIVRQEMRQQFSQLFDIELENISLDKLEEMANVKR
jgi:lipoate-protein ligase B